MPDTVHHVPLAEIDAEALPRDRTRLDPAELAELRDAIALSGLRMPIELFPLAAPRPPLRWGLLSGYRRFHAFRALHALSAEVGLEPGRFALIPAFLRPRAGLAEQLAQVVEENEIRAPLSPWERGRVACEAWRRRIFPTLDEAVARLFPSVSRQKRARLRAIAQVVEEFDGLLAAPELLNEHRLMRIHHAIQRDFGDIMRAALELTRRTTPEAQWELLLSYLIEAEEPPAKKAPPRRPGRPGRPRRIATIRDTLIVRRARTGEGWVLHFHGEEATSSLVDEIIDDIERRWGC
jgi:ParB family chromosome partitioning protein